VLWSKHRIGANHLTTIVGIWLVGYMNPIVHWFASYKRHGDAIQQWNSTACPCVTFPLWVVHHSPNWWIFMAYGSMIHDALAELLDHRTLVAVAESSLGLERARRLSRSTSLLSSHIIADHMWFFCYYLLLTFNCPELIHCRESLCPHFLGFTSSIMLHHPLSGDQAWQPGKSPVQFDCFLAKTSCNTSYG